MDDETRAHDDEQISPTKVLIDESVKTLGEHLAEKNDIRLDRSLLALVAFRYRALDYLFCKSTKTFRSSSTTNGKLGHYWRNSRPPIYLSSIRMCKERDISDNVPCGMNHEPRRVFQQAALPLSPERQCSVCNASAVSPSPTADE